MGIWKYSSQTLTRLSAKRETAGAKHEQKPYLVIFYIALTRRYAPPSPMQSTGEGTISTCINFFKMN